MPGKNLVACCVAAFASLSLYAQTPVVQAGNIVKVKTEGQVVNIQAEHANAQVIVYSPTVIRIRLNKETLADDFSYAVVGKPEQAKVSIAQSNGDITVQTDSLKAVISAKPFAVSFYNTAGQLLNKDEDGLTTSWIGTEVTTYKKMQDGERFIGLGEKNGNLDRVGTGYTNWNTDAFGYSTAQDPLYSTIPFYIGIHHGLTYGIFFDNSYESAFNFGASNDRFSSFGAKSGEMNYYFIGNSNVAGIIQSYTALTGRMPMPPLWSLGYQQNRYSYYPDTEVYRIAQTLREKKIPADGITLDIHYMDAYKLFTWNKDRFPEPKKMTDKLASMGFKTTVIVDPGIKAEKGYDAYEDGLKENIFLKYNDGKNYAGQVWPGWCNFPDFTSSKGRNWWQKQVTRFANDGISGIWNDMNEIATWGQKFPSNVVFDFDGHPTTHLQGHNVYALQMTRASYEGAKASMNKRPFLLTRAGYAGLQRYTAIWTGDNRSEDDHMLAGVRLLNSLGLSGVAFTGMDIGGFTGNPSVNLYTRWMQLGAFLPYFRNHTAVNTKSSEPWTFGEESMEISRNYVNMRYRLLPYLYSTFYEATQDGMPVVRSLAIDYTHDAAIYKSPYQDQFLFGKSIMVAPVEGNREIAKVYLPKNNWYDLYNDKALQGGQETLVELSMQKLPLYVKESSIIPMQSLIQSTMEKPTDTLTLHIYKGDITNSFVYYEDDGESFNYQQGAYYKRLIEYNPANKEIVLNAAQGSFASKFKTITFVLHGFSGVGDIKVNGSAATAKDGQFSFLSPISRFDPQGGVTDIDHCAVKLLSVANGKDKFSITYQ
ncbi:MAG: glycoside hydrolase family 31 protein [Filimonas sp.]|nr:glycoside hydrolase family 31 protein [Filimonas sp.]